MANRMRTPGELLDAYNDSQEIADGLRRVGHELDSLRRYASAYWCFEAAIHIEGLYETARQLARYVSKLQANQAVKDGKE